MKENEKIAIDLEEPDPPEPKGMVTEDDSLRRDRAYDTKDEIVFAVADEPEVVTSQTDTRNRVADDTVLEAEEDGKEPSEIAALARYQENVSAMKEETDGDSLTFPADCYSLISANGPASPFFWLGVVVFLFQMGFILLIVVSVAHPDFRLSISDDNPMESMIAKIIASHADPLVRATQLMSLVAMLVFADASMLDLVIAAHTFPIFQLATKKDKIGSIVFSCILRFIQGTTALFVALILVVSSSNVIDIILNFTALNFISGLDDVVFEFAGSGKYGNNLQIEINRITNLELPVCMYRKNKSHRYVKVLIALSVMIFGTFFAVVYAQVHPNIWEILIVRVEILEEHLKEYSGCYHKRIGLKSFGRNFYYNDRTNSSFGFCIDEKKWYLYKGDHFVPCDAKDYEIVIHSEDVDTFDISSSYLDKWFTNKDTPANVYFVKDAEQSESMCGHYLGNGICDDVFNNEFQGFDDGDCCSATCSGWWCGRDPKYFFHFDSRYLLFDSVYGDGFTKCKDPNMEPVTIHLNRFTSSKDFQPLLSDGQKQTTTEEPLKVLLLVECDGNQVLGVFIDDSAEDQMETIWVNDGAECEIFIENRQHDFDPIWCVDYSVYHGDKNTKEKLFSKMIEDNSCQNEKRNFGLIPRCYFGRFSVDDADIYMGELPSSRAVRWLADEDDKVKDRWCEATSKNQMLALATLNFAAPASDGLWMKKEFFCKITSIQCGVRGYHLNLSNQKNPLIGTIPDTIFMLEKLVSFNMAGNQLTGEIPEELGWPWNMTHIILSNNQLNGTIPILASAIKPATTLETLHLSENRLRGTIPTEIGKLTTLKYLNLSHNRLVGWIPSEIGLLSSLTSLELASNGLTGFISNKLTGNIPTEIGLLTNLQDLNFSNNSFFGPIPSEIGLLSSLTSLGLASNGLTGTIPNKIWLLTNLSYFDIDGNYLNEDSVPDSLKLNKSLSVLKGESMP